MASTSSLRLPGVAHRPSRPSSGTHDRWSWGIGRLFGIEVRVHATFPLLLVWVAMNHLMAHQGLAAAAIGVAFILAVFAIVVLHELGHALTARRFGVRTRDITLLPIGGVARLERMPSKPWQELLVALAGPAVNVVLALVLLLVLLAKGAVEEATSVALVGGPLLGRLLWFNVGIALFNLLPAFPMDGGRVLRSLLAMRVSYVRATDIAARVGQVLAVVFGIVGLFSNTFLVFIALFVWVGARAEARLARVHASLSGVPVWRAMVTRFAAVAPDAHLAEVAHSMLTGFQGDLPVVDGGRLVGVLAREDVLRAAREGDQGGDVASSMRRDVPALDADDGLDLAMDRLLASGMQSLPVVHEGQLVGVLPMETVAYVLQTARLEGAQEA